VKWSRIIDPRAEGEIARLERFDPEPLRCQENLRRFVGLRNSKAGQLLNPEDLGPS
jgi:hypothetical protein